MEEPKLLLLEQELKNYKNAVDNEYINKAKWKDNTRFNCSNRGIKE